MIYLLNPNLFLQPRYGIFQSISVQAIGVVYFPISFLFIYINQFQVDRYFVRIIHLSYLVSLVS